MKIDQSVIFNFSHINEMTELRCLKFELILEGEGCVTGPPALCKILATLMPHCVVLCCTEFKAVLESRSTRDYS